MGETDASFKTERDSKDAGSVIDQLMVDGSQSRKPEPPDNDLIAKEVQIQVQSRELPHEVSV